VRELNRYVDQQHLEDPQHREPQKLASLGAGVQVLRDLSAVLGLFFAPPAAAGGDDQLVGQLVELLIALRAEARSKRDFATADRIRDGLAEIGVTLEDRKDGTGWRLA
jgi:cysteinyl-tRNA synthetase